MGSRPDLQLKDGAATRSRPASSLARLLVSRISERQRRRTMQQSVITREGLERLSAELERLTTEGRREIAGRLERARATEANREESSDFLAAREEQALLERRIAVLEERLHMAELVEPQLGN